MKARAILYVIDCLRADHVSCYGYERKTTPCIDQVAREGVRFANAFSQATWTRPSAASILTGLYPSVHKTNTIKDRLPDTLQTFPEILQDMGVETAAISAIGNFSSKIGFDRGFIHFVDLFRDEHLLGQRQSANRYLPYLPYEDPQVELVVPLSEDINNVAFDWLSQHYQKSFFIMLWSMDPHDPYIPPDGYQKFMRSYTGKVDGSRESIERARSEDDIRHLIDLYDSEIYYNDVQFGRLVQYLIDLGIYDETLLIVTADHGEGFGEHYRFFGHGHAPYEEFIHVPLIVKPPGANNSKIVDSLVELIDIAPTIIHYFRRHLGDKNAYRDSDFNFQGRSLLPYIADEGAASLAPRTAIFSETAGESSTARYVAIRTERYKYIEITPPSLSVSNFLTHPRHFLRSWLRLPHRQFFDLTKDPFESHNLFNPNRKEVNSLLYMLEEWRRENQLLGNSIIREDMENDEVILEHLRGLGYID